MRIVVTGSRYQEDMGFVSARLDAIHANRPITRLAHGDCKGTDTLAAEWATSRGIETAAYPADWERWGRGAGPRRNAEMLEAEHPDLVIAFPGGRGTADLVAKAVRRGIAVIQGMSRLR